MVWGKAQTIFLPAAGINDNWLIARRDDPFGRG